MADQRLDDPQVEQRLTRLDDLLAQVEATPGPAGALAMEAVTALAEVYGEALARALAAAPPAAVEVMLGDPLLGHLLVLHGIHPEPVERRIERVLEGLHPGLGGEVSLVGVADGVAAVRLPAGCGHTTAEAAHVVREAVLAVAPELADVRPVAAARAPAFVPLDALRRPAGTP
ncbi:hypothetical protein [Geodermatophilus ruber]|uniref:Fe-S cluster biogenesis protein NfuA, 4Fe-4S-binding domain n=1 Tax=Geodermatophilus ruber TaxID=504800 RepID=A0A1I4EIM3_9ACTN|nr:hypothetical protein [Geodermatophilus ruber]SFL05585.1 Fe-S cluster biogenesis protein NfuA, 4Fe-4S-binding domain [Geodermatophilus ruber]